MERLCSTHHSSSSIASSPHWSPALPCPSGRSCCQCLLRILITLYLAIFVCSYVVFLSINSAGKLTKNAISESHSLESEHFHSTPSSVLCKLRDSSLQMISFVLSSSSLPIFWQQHKKGQYCDLSNLGMTLSQGLQMYGVYFLDTYWADYINGKNILISCNSSLSRHGLQKVVSCRGNLRSHFQLGDRCHSALFWILDGVSRLVACMFMSFLKLLFLSITIDNPILKLPWQLLACRIDHWQLRSFML